MNKKNILITFFSTCLFLITVINCYQNKTVNSRFSQINCLNQKPPGYKPEIFTPDLLSRDGDIFHSSLLFSQDGTELSWSIFRFIDKKPKGLLRLLNQKDGKWLQSIYVSKLEEGEYTEPTLLSNYIDTEYIDAYPFITPDESFILFCSSWPSLE